MSTTATLADLCELVTQQVDPTGVDPGLPYLGLEHLAPGRMTAMAHGRAGDVQSHKFAFRRGDVLYGKLRPYLDKAVLAEHDGVCTTELLVLRPKPGIDRQYLACVVHTPGMVEHAMSGVTGAHHPRTSWSHIARYAVQPLDEPEQKSVAALMWRIHHAIAASVRGEQVATQLKHAAMRALFSRGLRGGPQKETEFGPVPENWRIAELTEVAMVQTGVAKGRALRDAEVVEVPYLRVANVQDGHLDLREMKRITIRTSEIERYRLEPGDVVLTEGGDFDKLGRGFVWNGEVPGCVHQNHVFAVRADPTVLMSKFLAYLAQSPYGKAYFLKVAHKTTNLACINTIKLKALPVLIPDLPEQQEIVGILDAIDRKIDLHQRKKAVLEELFKSLLHKLMTGEVRVADLDLSALPAPEEACA